MINTILIYLNTLMKSVLVRNHSLENCMVENKPLFILMMMIIIIIRDYSIRNSDY